MKNNMFRKLNRIALISIAVAALMACSSLTAFAAESTPPADTRTKVVYNGSGAAKAVTVENANDLNTFKNLMPNGTTNPQDIIIQNKSGQKMQVYFRAVPTADGADKGVIKSLLNTLTLKITFKMDGKSAEQVLYDGPASGKTSDKDIISAPISLGYVYENSDSGVISATLKAPETMDNQFQRASAKITWVIQFELSDPYNPGGHDHGHGGGGGGGTIPDESSQPPEIIGAESTPQGGPASSALVEEAIVNEKVPLSKPPKTGENATSTWAVLAVALTACLVFIITRRKLKTDSSSKNG